MADNALTAARNGGTSFTGQVLHVVSAQVAARWAPMLRQTLWALAESGIREVLVTEDSDLPTALADTDVEIQRVDRLSGLRGWRLGAFLTRRTASPPAVIHMWGTDGLGWVRWWADRRGIPVLIYALDAPQAESLAGRKLGATHHVAVAAAPILDAVTPRTARTPATWQHVPPAVALPFPSTEMPDGPRTLSVLCTSGLGDLAGLQVLIDAVAQLRGNGFDVQCVIVGDGARPAALWQRIHAHRIGACCVVIDEPALWEKGLPGADVCVVPGPQRELWLTPLLAMGLGKLVIAARNQVAEWFIEGETAWQFTPRSSEELAYLLSRAIEQPRQLRQIQNSAREYFDAHHSVHELVNRLVAAYNAALTSAAAVTEKARVHHNGA